MTVPAGDGPTETRAERIARIARSPAAQAAVDSAPPLTRPQIDIIRAACASATARFYERAAAEAREAGRG